MAAPTKQRILDEIRRTAKDNNGKPLGRLRFEQVTGIMEHDWRGRHWSRWNDAIAEAGLSPNKMTAPHDDSHLLSALAALTRELGRFPTTSEMQLKRRSDPTFPSQRVFDRRFGGKQSLIRRTVEHCANQVSMNDVVAICTPLLTQDEPRATTPASEDGFEVGYVYLALMKVGREKRYKIGKANLVDQRARQVAVNLPEELELIHAISTDDAYGIEGYWHRRFADKRRGGEWFQLTADDVRTFKRRKFM
jgi:Meiotically up-regulated gene 113